MLADSSLFVLFQYVAQCILALIIVLILLRFYVTSANNRGFKAWSWSWIAWALHMAGAAFSIYNVNTLVLDHPVRLAVSVLTVGATILQIIWLINGTFELAYNRTTRRKYKWLQILGAVLLSIMLVLAYQNEPGAGSTRVFLRVGVTSLFSGIAYIYCAIILFRFLKTGIGIKFILISFILYGLQQMNYFGASFSFFLGTSYPFSLPFYMGSIDLVLQAAMGMGMIINMLELERQSLKKANMELDTFLYRSSHDLRAPLTTILGIVDILRLEKSHVNTDKYIDYIHDRVLKADGVINDIIQLRKGQKAELRVAPIDVNEFCNELLRRYEPIWKDKVRFIKEYGEECNVVTDVDRLNVILDNLITNAVLYRKTDDLDSFVQIKTAKTQKGISVEIKDNGQGIAQKHMTRIFDMFYRANVESEGSGLGLYMVKEAVNDINSEISIQSKVGVGTTFHLLIRDLS